MLRQTKRLTGYTLQAKDGEIGRVHDFLFEDECWQIRYLVADTRKWLPGRKVIIPPSAIDEPLREEKKLPVSMTKEQIQNAPPLSENQPVSRQHESDLYQYFQWQPYWAGGALLGEPYATSTHETTQDEGPVREDTADTDVGKTGEDQEPNLRSFRELKGYAVLTKDTDGEAGKLEDFIYDDESWKARYLEVDIGSWLPGKHVLVAVDWIQDVHWAQASVKLNLKKEKVEGSPEFDPESKLDRELEKKIYEYYGRSPYWKSSA